MVPCPTCTLARPRWPGTAFPRTATESRQSLLRRHSSSGWTPWRTGEVPSTVTAVTVLLKRLLHGRFSRCCSPPAPKAAEVPADVQARQRVALLVFDRAGHTLAIVWRAERGLLLEDGEAQLVITYWRGVSQDLAYDGDLEQDE